MKNLACYVMLSVFFAAIIACNGGNKKSEKEGAATYSDFLQLFPALELPYQYNKDSLAASFPDSLRLDKKKWIQYIPDSVWLPGGSIYPVGKNHYGKLHLLLAAAVTASARQVELLVYGAADTLVTTKEVASGDTKHFRHVFTFRLDDNHLLHIHERKELDNGHVITREQVYAIGEDGSLALILTNTNQPASTGSFYNPIDTLPRKHRYSGDYTSGKSDIVSIRDGDRDGTFRFFIHLNKNDGDCTGEIDGTGKFISKNVGEFREDDGPCAIRFTFSPHRVTIKETGGCGAYRGISCYFDGTYKSKQ